MEVETYLPAIMMTTANNFDGCVWLCADYLVVYIHVYVSEWVSASDSYSDSDGSR